jgi:cell division protein FtsW (lipid II flippase)/cell division protein FtsI/penicillin-binding protein 2
MENVRYRKAGRGLERTFIFLISALMAFLFFRLYAVLEKDWEEVPKRISEGSMINLNDADPAGNMRMLLQRGFYFEDPKDIAIAHSVLQQRMHTEAEKIDNIGELNKRTYDVNADLAFASGGEAYKKRVRVSRSLLGYSGDDSIRFVQEKNAPPPLPAVNNIGLGSGSINGTLYNAAGQPLRNVLVRLSMILPQDSMYSDEVTEVENLITENKNGVLKIYAVDSAKRRQLQSLSAYARPDGGGKFSFTNLQAGKSYEVIPLQPGYQFGPSKGVQQLKESVSFSFYQAPHVIRLFSTKDFNNLKKEKALIVRTPSEFQQSFFIIVGSFFLCFLLLHFLLSIRAPQADQLVLPLIMLLTGISFITLLSLQDPLRDRFLAQSMWRYFIVGVIIIGIMLFVNMRRFTTDSLLYRVFTLRKMHSSAKGWQWGILAIMLLILTILFGTGPEGSGVKVNLFGFQPSEVVKFLIVLFLAGFFAANERFISEYTGWKKRWSFFWFALIAIVTSIILFLVLGDLGPAIVCCFSFIILFSFSRGDFGFMTASVVLYVLSVWILKNVWLATGITAVVLLLAMLFWRKQISESAIMALVVIAGFLLLDQIPFLDEIIPGPINRLVDRKAIWQDPWNNEVFGGDQIANGIWAMSSGGVTGQGIGEGFAKTIPEAHTDMILPSFGEEFGWAGIICVFILFLIYLHRSIIIGRQTGTPFLFYLCAGIGISTFVQFLLIAGGSIGALPLSGVSLPLVSYGGSSLICNLLAAGVLLSASKVQGSAAQMKYITRQQDRNLVPALIAACIGIVLLSITVSKYLFNNKKWVVEPALVADRSGARMFSYNPRIAILMNRLQAGNLYDRNGRLLATSKPEVIIEKRDSLLRAGLDKNALQSLVHKRLDRYYPFAEQMFFWTGDLNTGIFMGGTNGYFGEYEHLAELRGFATPTTNFNVTATRFREDRFLPQTVTEMTVAQKDYNVLAPLLLAGINSNAVEEFKQRNRDVQLTMDARLQTTLQKSFATDDSLRTKRISVVIMEDNTGDVLASANYPLPMVNDWETLNLSVREQNKLSYWLTNSDLGFTLATQPGSTAKLVTALAAFNKLGDAAITKTKLVRPGDLIRVKSDEPDETGNITIERGIVKSNNPFFIRLANEEQLQEEMGTLYMQAGMFLRGVGGYYFERERDNAEQENKWRDLWRKTEFRSLRSYDPNNIRRTRGRGVSGMAWGQGELIATPVSVARISAGIANNGILMPNRYVLKISDSAIGLKQGEAITKDTYAQLMTRFMQEQSANKTERLGLKVAGKTGTPERVVRGQRINDGWYTFFAPKANGAGHVVVCIRIEDVKGSSVAVRMAGKHVIPVLKELGYVKSFDQEKRPLKETIEEEIRVNEVSDEEQTDSLSQ